MAQARALKLWRELLGSSKGGFLSTSKSYATGQELESLSFRTLLGSIYNSLMLKSLRNICFFAGIKKYMLSIELYFFIRDEEINKGNKEEKNSLQLHESILFIYLHAWK